MSDIRYNSWLHRSGSGGVYQDSSGQVGIGSSVPAGDINIRAQNPNIRFDDSDTANNGEITLDNTQLRIEVDEDNAIGSSQIKFRVDGSDKATIDSSGRLLIGTTTEGNESADELTVASSGNTGITIRSGTSSNASLFFSDATSGADEYRGFVQYLQSSDDLKFGTATSERMRITSGGDLLIGSTSSRTLNSHAPKLQVTGTTYSHATVSIINNANDSNGAYLFFGKQRSGAAGGSTVVNDNDIVGHLRFSAGDGTDMESRVAYIEAFVDGTPGGNDTPGRLTFSTTPDGSDTPAERMRITSAGTVGINQSSPDSNSMLDVMSDKSGTTVNSNRVALFRTNGGGRDAHITLSNSSNTPVHIGQLSSHLYFTTNNTERMRITSTGDVTIAGTGNLTVYSDRMFFPVFHAHDVANSGAVQGWKNIDWNSKVLDSCSGWDNSSLNWEPDKAGYYLITFSHAHTGGHHDEYEIEIKVGGTVYANASSRTDRISCSCLAYMNGSGNYVEWKVYHSNNSHACDNGDKRTSCVAYRLSGVT